MNECEIPATTTTASTSITWYLHCMLRTTLARRTKPEELRDSLVAMDLSKFDMDKLIALRGISPSMEDLPKLKAYDGELSKLDEVWC